jgi:hypothetical protein
VIAIDTNVLVYAHRAEMPLHEVALTRLRDLVEGVTPWALPVFCIGEFLRVVTHDRIFHPPSDLETALAFLDQVLGSPAARLLVPGATFPTLFAEACRDGAVRGSLAFDVQLVAVCREHGIGTILTEDRDFARFKVPAPLTLEA